MQEKGSHVKLPCRTEHSINERYFLTTEIAPKITSQVIDY